MGAAGHASTDPGGGSQDPYDRVRTGCDQSCGITATGPEAWWSTAWATGPMWLPTGARRISRPPTISAASREASKRWAPAPADHALRAHLDVGELVLPQLQYVGRSTSYLPGRGGVEYGVRGIPVTIGGRHTPAVHDAQHSRAASNANSMTVSLGFTRFSPSTASRYEVATDGVPAPSGRCSSSARSPARTRTTGRSVRARTARATEPIRKPVTVPLPRDPSTGRPASSTADRTAAGCPAMTARLSGEPSRPAVMVRGVRGPPSGRDASPRATREEGASSPCWGPARRASDAAMPRTR